MNLQDLSSKLPKPWLNINANSVNNNSSYTSLDFSLGFVSTNNGTGTFVITPSELVNGLIGANGVGPLPLTILLPTAAEINAYLPSRPSNVDNVTFSYKVCTSSVPGNAGVKFVLPPDSSISIYDGIAILMPANTQKVFYFTQNNLSPNWVIYH